MSLYNIALHQDFFSEFVLGFYKRIPKSELKNSIVLLPSLRACKILEQHFGSEKPKILPLTAVEQVFTEVSYSSEEKVLSSSELKLFLIEFLTKRSKISPIDSLEISEELISFIARFERDEISLSKINEIFLGDIPERARYVFSALEIISKDWSQFLAKKNKITETQRRNNFIQKLVKKWQANQPKVHIVIAGSLGTFSSTRSLMKAVSNLANGHIILHGVENLNFLNHQVDEMHPCYQLKQIIDYLGESPENTKYWGNVGCNEQWRSSLTTFLIGAESCHNQPLQLSSSFYYQECRSVHEEISVIVNQVRDLEKRGIRNIGIITNDRIFGRRLIQSLELHNIVVETNNIGSLLVVSEVAFILAIYRAWKEDFSPTALLNLISHNLFLFNTENKSKILGKLEIDYLRGVRKYKSLDELIAICRDDKNDDIVLLLQIILDSNLNSNLANAVTCADLLQELINAAEFLSSASDSKVDILWNDDYGRRVFEVFSDLLEYFTDIKINVGFFENIFIKLLDGYRLHDLKNDAKVSVLSSIESRLLKFEYVILAGMNEGAWNTVVDIDPFLGAVLYDQLGIDSYKTKIGQSASDFIFLLQNKNILITRSHNQNNSPQKPYRFLDKLEVWGQKNNILAQIKKTIPFAVSTDIDVILYQQPSPRPPVFLRPKKFSVTQIEKLIRDPYSIYSSMILKLIPLQPLDKKPGNLEFGNLVHQALNIFNKTYYALKDVDYHSNMLKIGNMLLSQIPYSAYVDKIWRPRFVKIATWLTEYEQLVRKSHNVSTELKLSLNIDGYILTAKIDRLERSSTQISIIDFKTGSLPTKEDVVNGFSPQLPLEALLINKTEHNVNLKVSYIKLGVGDKIGKAVNIPLEDMMITYEEGIRSLLCHYSNVDMPYLVCPITKKRPAYNEYDHFERSEETNLF
jgi:ATP-dependent helicase/nuclease subunit B